MKRKQLFSLLIFSVLLLAGCQPEEFETPPPADDVLSRLSGSWGLRRVTQRDETAEIRNSPYVVMDLTPLFPYTEYKLSLNGTGTAATGDYTAVPGAAPRIIRSNSGKWVVDDLKNPRFISFINGTDTTRMEIGSYPTSFNEGFKLKQTKLDKATGKPAISYQYEFVKQ